MPDTNRGIHQVLTVTSMKGGVGKTTISAMLARYAVESAPTPSWSRISIPRPGSPAFCSVATIVGSERQR